MTDEELDRKMAEVMGWQQERRGADPVEYPKEHSEKSSYLAWVDPQTGEVVFTFKDWQPHRRIEQAMMVLESKFQVWSILHPACIGVAYRCQINLYEPREWEPTGEADLLPLAICLAIAEATKGGDADEKRD